MYKCENSHQKYYTNIVLLPPTLRRRRMVLQSLRGFSFSVSPRLLQLELCFCSSQHTHTPSLSNFSWEGGGGNTHPHSCMHATYTLTNTHTHRHTNAHAHKDTCTDQTWAILVYAVCKNTVVKNIFTSHWVKNIIYFVSYLLLRKWHMAHQKHTTKDRLLDIWSYPGRDGRKAHLCNVSQIERKQDMNPTSMG